MVALDKRGAFQQILRRVATQAKLGEYGQPGAALLRLRRQDQNASRIPCKIADSGIELSESYLHALV
jgi:hypothetical protein